MEDKLIDSVRDIKSKIDDLFIFTSQVCYNNQHPLRTIHACKSLIGINPNNPPRILLKWLEEYMKNYKPNFQVLTMENLKELPEVITYSHLNELIAAGKKDESYEYLGFLLKSAGPSSIAEYLVELAVQISAANLLFCWSALRSIQFVGEQEGYPLLYHCISNLTEKEKKSDENNLIEYEMHCHQFHIRKTEMVRSSKIVPLLEVLLQSLNPDMSQTMHGWIPETLTDMIQAEGVSGIQSYILTLKAGELSKEIILKLDALRSAILFSGFSLNEILTGTFIQTREIQNA